jgi:hypothetical protein
MAKYTDNPHLLGEGYGHKGESAMPPPECWNCGADVTEQQFRDRDEHCRKCGKGLRDGQWFDLWDYEYDQDEKSLSEEPAMSRIDLPRHTPAPWVYYNARAHQNGSPVYTLTSLTADPPTVHDGIWLADVRMGRRDDAIDTREGMANAMLIASAPNLLEACRQTLAMIDEWRGRRQFTLNELAKLHAVVVIAAGRALGLPPAVIDESVSNAEAWVSRTNGSKTETTADTKLLSEDTHGTPTP